MVKPSKVKSPRKSRSKPSSATKKSSSDRNLKERQASDRYEPKEKTKKGPDRYEVTVKDRGERRTDIGDDRDVLTSDGSRDGPEKKTTRSDFIEFDNRSRDSAGYSHSGSKRSVSSRSRRSRGGSRKTEEDVKKKEARLRSMHNAATKYVKDGQNRKALTLFKRILRVHTDHYWNEHSRIGAALHNIAIVHLRTGNLDDAADAIEEAIRVRTLALGEHNSKVVDSIIEKGIILLARDEHTEALDTFHHALDCCDKRVFLGDKETLVSKIQNNIGCVHFAIGEFRSATNGFEEALETQRLVLEDEMNTGKSAIRINLASTLCNIAFVQIESDRFESSMESLDEALKIQKAVLSEYDPLILETLDNLGFCHAIEGHFADAMKHYEDLLELQEELYGSKELECADTLKKMAFIDLKRYNLEDAREKIMRVQKIQERHLGSNDRELQETMKVLDDLNYEILRYPTAGEAISSLFACCGPPPEYMAGKHIRLVKPLNRGKVSGHKIAYY